METREELLAAVALLSTTFLPFSLFPSLSLSPCSFLFRFEFRASGDPVKSPGTHGARNYQAAKRASSYNGPPFLTYLEPLRHVTPRLRADDSWCGPPFPFRCPFAVEARERTRGEDTSETNKSRVLLDKKWRQKFVRESRAHAQRRHWPHISRANDSIAPFRYATHLRGMAG